jgi:hypothetical protein
MPSMFGRKRSKEAPQQSQAPQSAPSAGSSSPWQSYDGKGGYVVTELPYYDKGKRKVIVYTSDPSGKIIKTFKK